MTSWQPPPSPRPPRQLAPATIEPTPLECTTRDISSPGAPIVLTPLGCDHVRRLASIGASDTAISSALRLSRATFRELKRRQPEVREALAQGRATLHVELQNHLLTAARDGQWGAAGLLLKLRFGEGGNTVATSAQGQDDDEADERKGDAIDWKKVPSDEIGFLGLAVTRLDELVNGKTDNTRPGHRFSVREREALACHVALAGLAESLGAHSTFGLEQLAEVLRLPELFAFLRDRGSVDALRQLLAAKPTADEIAAVRVVRMTPHERRLALAEPIEPNSDQDDDQDNQDEGDADE